MKTRKNTQRKSVGILMSVWALFVSWTQKATAAVYGGNGIQDGIDEISGLGGISSARTLNELIVKVIQFILDIILLLAVGAIIIAGVYLIVSNGDEGNKDKAKRIVYYAVFGIVLVLLSRVIVIFVNTIFQ